MTPNEIRTMLKQASRAWVTGDADAFAALFTPEGEFTVPGKRWQGQAAIREVAAGFADRYSNVQIDIRRIIVDGNQAVVEWRWEDLKKATGVRSKADDAIVVDFEDRLISRWREYIDTQSPAVGESPVP
jgi:uncharacterized protein (TIGR02246 family)